VAVMAINGLLTKNIFDHNPKNEFFVEESFPLDWMYPYLTPFGVIMKINRNPLPELSEEICRRDHEFWKSYSKRLTGDIIDYDTPVKKIADFIEKTYLHRDFSGFTGDRKFVRDDSAQKAFSKLRSSIGGLYAWRISDPNNHNPATQQRMIREAEFSFKQAFAFCPYSPEAVFRYANLLLSMRRFEDAYIIASTCQKLDPNNAQVLGLVKQLKTMLKEGAEAMPPSNGLEQAEKTYQANPNDFQNAFNLAGAYLQMGQTNRGMDILNRAMISPKADGQVLRTLVPAFASINQTSSMTILSARLEAMWKTNATAFEAAVGLAEALHFLKQDDRADQVLDQVVASPRADANAVLMVAQEYSGRLNYLKIETALAKLVTLVPESPEAWYDLAGVRAALGKTPEASSNLGKALDLYAKRPKKDPKARDLVAESQKEPRFAAVRQSPEYQKMIQQK
jgi:thioredoxin-like negative regulator of GroEL